MYAVVRHYENAKALSDAMAAAEQEVRDTISAIPGFISYYVTRDGDMMTSITICETREACEESSRAAKEWVREHVKSPLSPPVVSQGDVFIKFSK
ncbi:MAG TPA: hypothetical protein VF042_07185 [Gemmatimonadaceae bacterium]